ncbi:IPT/TIG domain-containing protein [Thermodesulfobacteriota bacterium]
MNKNLFLTLTALLAAGLCLAASGCPPRINSINPGAAQVGETVQITGAEFGDVQGESTVSFAGTDAGAADSWRASEIVVTVPEGAVTGPVVVVVEEVASNERPFMILNECDGFDGGAFDFSPIWATDDCFDGWLSGLVELALATVDLDQFNPVAVPPSADLPKGFDMEFPSTGILTFAVNLGTENCWEGSLSGPGEPIVLDLNEMTWGMVNCSVVIGDVAFTLDPASDDEISFEISMEVDSLEGESCPENNAPGCTMSVLIGGQRVTPEG